MLVEEKSTRQLLRQIVCKVTNNRGLHDDLVQEAFIHLWLREQEHPGQRPSWYFQSCRFFLQNFIRNGRSIDSTRHQKARCYLTDTHEEHVDSVDDSASGNSVPALVSARELVPLLNPWLTPIERQILSWLVDGTPIRQVAARLNLSHTSVTRCRRKIASVALRLGVEPLAGKVWPVSVARERQAQENGCFQETAINSLSAELLSVPS
jgi:DNA-directed RNA polymerase specialized sigma24 family protein